MAKKKETPKPLNVDEQVAQLGLPSPDAAAMFTGAATQPAPIGAPEQFFTPTYQGGMQLPGQQLPPGFQPWRSGDEALPGTWDRLDKARLQTLMQAAGLYGDKVPVAGMWRSEDAAAMRQVLEFANYQGIDSIDEAVRQYSSTLTAAGVSARSARAPLVVQFANPESVRQVVRKTSMELMGRRLSDAEEAKIISGFQAQSAAAQRATYAAGEAGGGATAPMDATTYATAQLEGTEEAGDQRFLSAFDRMAKTFTDTVVEGPTLTGKGGVR